MHWLKTDHAYKIILFVVFYLFYFFQEFNSNQRKKGFSMSIIHCKSQIIILSSSLFGVLNIIFCAIIVNIKYHVLIHKYHLFDAFLKIWYEIVDTLVAVVIYVKLVKNSNLVKICSCIHALYWKFIHLFNYMPLLKHNLN